MSTFCRVVIFATLALFCSASHAAIVWGPATNISGDSDVSTTGTLVGAFSLGDHLVSNPETINGTTFSTLQFTANGSAVTSGQFTLNGLNNAQQGYDQLPVAAPFADLSTSYQDLLSSYAEVGPNADLFIHLTGLTIGDTYLFEVWSSFPYHDPTVSPPALNVHDDVSVFLQPNSANVDGGLGQFAIGTFTAVGTTENFTIDNNHSQNDFSFINAFQLRDTTAAPTPEPTSIFVWTGLMGAAAWGMRRRRATFSPSTA